MCSLYLFHTPKKLPHNNLGMNQIHTALGAGNNQQCSLNDGDFRSLAGRSGGTIYMSDFRGKQVGGGGGAHEGLREIFVRDYHNENRNFFNGKHRLHDHINHNVEHYFKNMVNISCPICIEYSLYRDGQDIFDLYLVHYFQLGITRRR